MAEKAKVKVKGEGATREAPPQIMLLKQVPLFATLPTAQLELLAKMVVRKRYPKNTVILVEGDDTDALHIIISGRIKVLISDEDGREVILSLLERGEYFGEMGLLDDSPRSASVETLEECELMSMSKGDFKRCLADHSEMAMYIMRNLVKRLREADKKIESLALVDVYGRVARVLLEQAENLAGRLVVSKRLTKQDIAKMVGASREMVSRVMKDLQQRGYFRVEDGKIVLTDRITVLT